MRAVSAARPGAGLRPAISCRMVAGAAPAPPSTAIEVPHA
jgi:hypothetical protein